MLRVRDPVASLSFYVDKLGMTLLDKLEFPQYSFDLYFLTTLPKSEGSLPSPGTAEAHRNLWNFPRATLELTHNYGSNTYHPGNGDRDGFGHVAFHVDDVYKATDDLIAAGVEFKKKPDEGKMKGLAFAYDPDGYWVELVKRAEGHGLDTDANLSQTMLRIKDPKKSIPFYESLGFSVLTEKHFPQWKFSLYFLGCLQPDETPPGPDATDEERSRFINGRQQPVLELTHNHGTEDDASFQHKTGNEEGFKGFGHLGVLVDDVGAACDFLESSFGHGMKKGPQDGNMKGLAFALDPDGYWVEIIKRGGYDSDCTPYYFEDK